VTRSGSRDGSCANGLHGSLSIDSAALQTHQEAGRPRVPPPIVATYLVKLACELPDDVARSLSTWDCAELCKKLIDDGVVDSISPSSVRRILASHKLRPSPWRVHHWLSSDVPRDEAFRQAVRNVCDLYTRQLGAHERVLSVDEKTSLQPRTRTSATRPTHVPNAPVRVEHEYVRKGALNLFAAFDTWSGRVTNSRGVLRPRKRQVEFIELLEKVDRETPAEITLIHLVADNISIHRGKLAHA
jgi:hypothetical protein